MAGKIKVLSEQAINEIAAGEVIENPASVVKELVENAIDAEATSIIVEIKGGGRQLIRISDDGVGMGKEDAHLCLERHATSKIRNAAEIFEIGTLGFRGEAIPSIAAISKFTLLTRARTDEESDGTLILVDGGKVVSSGPAARASGTTVEVKQLFFNVPVRKKFQRSPIYDAQEVEKMLTALALAHPQLSFQLISDNETVLRVQGGDASVPILEQLGRRIGGLFGEERQAAFRPVEDESNGMKLMGYVSLPHLHRPTRSGQFLFVNGRHVVAPQLARAIQEGYGTLLPTNRHPLFILKLTLAHGTVDVNVHPQKREVRFLQGERLRELLQRGVATAMHGTALQPKVDLAVSQPSIDTQIDSKKVDTWLPPLSALEEIESESSSLEPCGIKPAALNFFSSPPPLPWDDTPLPELSSSERVEEAALPLNLQEAKTPALLATLVGYLLLEPTEALASPLLSVVSKTTPFLFLVDQRRAHQRILFEKLSMAQASQVPEVQPLLFPYIFDTTTAEARMLQEKVSQLNTMGLDLRQISPISWAIEALPAYLGEIDLKLFIENLLANLEEESQHKGTFEMVLAKNLCLAATKASLAAARRLTYAEGSALISQLCCCHEKAFCPQGHPIATVIMTEGLAKLPPHEFWPKE